MTDFICRVELHGESHNSAAYILLHAEMAQQGYVRTIKTTEDGVIRDLPPAEYILTANCSARDAFLRAMTAAKKIRAENQFSILCTQSAGIFVHNLAKTKA